MLPSLWGRHWPVGSDKSDPFQSLHAELDRMLGGFGREARLPEAEGMMLSPAVDVSESDDAIEVTAELPGIEEKDISVELDEGTLTIKAEKRAQKEEKKQDYHMVERVYGSYRRRISLPADVDSSKVTATFTNGVLHVTIPKPAKAERKTKKITVKAA